MASSLEMNKVLAAVLLGGLVAMLSGQAARYLVQPETHAPAGVTVADAPAGEESPGAGDQPAVPLASLLAAADPAAGQKIFGRCTSCHTIEKGGPNRVGPNLWATVGKDIAGHSGFSYSAVLAQMEGSWDFEKLNAFLTSPRNYAPGTKMTFAGLSKPEDRAALLVWLNQQSDAALPLPEAPVEPAPASAAPGNSGSETPNATPDETAPTGTGSSGAPENPAGSDTPGSSLPALEGDQDNGAGTPPATAPEPPAPAPATQPSTPNDAPAETAPAP